MNRFPAENFFKPPMVKLLDALQRGDERSVKNQLASGLSLDVIGEQGITPLFWLALNQDKEAAQLALKLGADPNFADGQGRTPVYVFAGSIWTDWLKMVLDAGVDPNARPSKEHNPPIFQAIYGRKPLENTQLLVSYGADVNIMDDNGTNSVLFATRIARFDVALWLAEHGADICMTDSLDGNVPSVIKIFSEKLIMINEYGLVDDHDMLKFKAFLESRHAYPPGPQSICH